MGSIRAIGFDMDHTLVPYNRDTFEALAFRETLKKFIAAGYPEELSTLEFHPSFSIRGLLVDRDRGNLLKVDGHKYVKIAMHGRQTLDKETRWDLYNRESFRADAFLSVDSFFALSEVQLFAEIVDYMSRNPGKINKTFNEVYSDLRQFIDLSHADGSIKSEVLRNPERFVHRDKYLPETLFRLIEGGKHLFLLTNSAWDYTSAIMSFTFDGSHPEIKGWRDFFSHVIVGSSKPGFFMGTQPFFEVVTDSNLLKTHGGKLDPGHVYHGGNARLFQRSTGFKGDEILYVGDHLYSDIIRSKGLFNWRTMLVVEELENELPRRESLKPMLDTIRDTLSERERLDEEHQIMRNKLLAAERQRELALHRGEKKKAGYIDKELEKHREKFAELDAQVSEIEKRIKEMIATIEKDFHPVWGQTLRVGLERSRFADQLEDYACLYTSRVANLRFYSPFKRFTSAHDVLPHEL